MTGTYQPGPKNVHKLIWGSVTEHRGHMVELAEKISLDFDAIVVLSGDGGVHEVINGLSNHPDVHKALRIPIAQVPTGSANAVCVNILGPKVGKALLSFLVGFLLLFSMGSMSPKHASM